MNIKQEWVTSSEAAKLLKMERSRFFYYVEARKIRTKPGESKRKTLYNREDIIKVREELGLGRSPGTIIDWVAPSDITSTLALDYLVYQEAILGDINLYIAWVKRNNRITLASFDENDRKNVYAYICILPLKEEKILQILREEWEDNRIDPQDIETYEREGKYTLLAESAVCHPDYPEKLGEVLRAWLDYWCQQYPDRSIDKIYTHTVSEAGDILVQKLFFSPLYETGPNAHILDLKRPGASRFIKRFQECIKSKEKEIKAG
jgi:hypothetical protein